MTSDQVGWLRRRTRVNFPTPRRGSVAAGPDIAAGDEERAARQRVERYHENFPERSVRIGAQLTAMLKSSGVTGGRVLEIGGRTNPYREWFPDFEYVCLDLDPGSADDGRGSGPSGGSGSGSGGGKRGGAGAGKIGGTGMVRGDITNCPELESGSFDAVISVDVLEHVREPWLAVPEIIRLLRPGGFTYHSTVFSWRYQPSPVDFWRFSPDALMFLFRELRVMRSEFDVVERRRNLIGKGRYRIEPDAFGGWRENWRSFYAGVKNE